MANRVWTWGSTAAEAPCLRRSV
ncbi:hypothetical protein CTAM01_01669 [Colletotrichum tamarilloi]|uniref:Uncharacterized protein n=1 Tax=Colletotrichum tamarilloi TaxID=1209934 RepID=A0ABQ9RPW0_9PEZI|nr:hypothetical protein CSPX01_07834 [Colletotrichum filicis]KAK1509546.1 hypothetical protein CTAM01_01669 [Colletotrichum tamarilloi]